MSAAIARAGSVQVRHQVVSQGQRLQVTGVIGRLNRVDRTTRLRLTGPGLLTGRPVDVRLLADVVYIRGAQGTVRPWAAMPVRGSDDPYWLLIDAADPGQVAALLAQAERVRRVGTATLAGRSTTRYVVTLDTAEALRRVGLVRADRVPGKVDVEVWLDERDLPVRFRLALGRALRYDMHFVRWGVPVEVDAPPAGQVQRLP